MPGGRKRPGFRLAVADRNGNNEIRIVERRSICVRDGVPKFTTFVNRTRCLWRAVRTYSPGKRKLPEEFEHAGFVAALVWINLGVMAFEVAVGQRGGCAMTGTGDIEDI